jgi:hypothetical protein
MQVMEIERELLERNYTAVKTGALWQIEITEYTDFCGWIVRAAKPDAFWKKEFNHGVADTRAEAERQAESWLVRFYKHVAFEQKLKAMEVSSEN